MVARLVASESERIGFESDCRATIARRLRKGLPSTIAVSAAMIPTAWFSYPEVRLYAMLPPVLGVVYLAAGTAAARLRALEERPLVLCVALAWGVTFITSIGAAHTGEFLSPFYSVIYLIWLFALAFMPFSPSQILLVCAPQPIFACVVFLATGVELTRADALAFAVNAGALLYAVVGVVIRQREALESFVAQTRLSTARASLADLNSHLEARVTAQVSEIVKHASDVEALNEQLRHRVAERSRELARALQMAAAKPAHATFRPDTGTFFAGRLYLREVLGEGGMGLVFAADDRVTGRRVAVKIMGSDVDVSALRRFLAEAEAAAAIADPSIVKTLHVDVDERGRAFLIQELVQGITLASFAQRGARQPAAVVARIGAGIARAIAAAHGAGIIHRDVKPSNVILCAEWPNIRVLDFGVSKILRDDDATLTAAGVLVGTPAYMAPEQAQDSSNVGGACDVYALGVVLFELATGSLQFDGKDPIAMIVAHAVAPLRDPRLLAPELPASLATLILAALARDPKQRPSASVVHQSLVSLADALGAPRPELLLTDTDTDRATATPALQ